MIFVRKYNVKDNVKNNVKNNALEDRMMTGYDEES